MGDSVRIVQFKNGKYGIRKWSLLFCKYMFLDLQHYRHWWPIGSRWIVDCQGDLEIVQGIYEMLTDKGSIIK